MVNPILTGLGTGLGFAAGLVLVKRLLPKVEKNPRRIIKRRRRKK